MFIGISNNLIDAKNRVIVPAKYRDELNSKCILTRGLDDCLVFYPMKTWEEQQAKYAQLPRSNANARAFLRYTYANAVECEIDKQGRTVIPANLRELAHIDKEIVIIGMLDRVELWSKEVYENDENGGKIGPEDLEKFSESFQV